MENRVGNTGVNLREVLIEEHVRKIFELITQFKSTINRYINQEDWLLKTKKHMGKLEKKLKHEKLKSCGSSVRIVQVSILHALNVLTVIMIFFLF